MSVKLPAAITDEAASGGLITLVAGLLGINAARRSAACGTSLFEEVQPETSPQYWEYIARKVGTFERTWVGFNPRETKQK